MRTRRQIHHQVVEISPVDVAQKLLDGLVKHGPAPDHCLILGKEVAHPNTTEHHIRWISVYFHPEGAKFPYEIGHFEFSAHGESVDGPNTGPVYTHHEVTTAFKTTKPGTIFATSLCNIHGLWRGEKALNLA